MAQFCAKLLSNFYRPTITPVRFKYHADLVAKRPIIRDYGYNDNLKFRGLLPRNSNRPLPKKQYRPRNVWDGKHAHFGQNDYIDILGHEAGLHPSQILYNVPSWLRGFGGNEYQMLLRRQKFLRQSVFPFIRFKKWKEIKKRTTYLYKWLNQKTKTGFCRS